MGAIWKSLHNEMDLINIQSFTLHENKEKFHRAWAARGILIVTRVGRSTSSATRAPSWEALGESCNANAIIIHV